MKKRKYPLRSGCLDENPSSYYQGVPNKVSEILKAIKFNQINNCYKRLKLQYK